MEILGRYVDQPSGQKVSNFVAKNKMNYPVVMATTALFKDYTPPQASPTTLVIDRTGKIQYKKVGMMSKKEMIGLFNKFSK